MTYVAAFIGFYLLFRWLFSFLVPPLPQLPTTVDEWLVSPIPLAVEVENATCDHGSAATLYNRSAAMVRMQQ